MAHVTKAAIAVVGAILLWALQPLPPLLFGETLSAEFSLTPHWFSLPWVAATVVFGLALVVGVLVARTVASRWMWAALATTAWIVTPALCVSVALAPEPAVSFAPIMLTYSLTRFHALLAFAIAAASLFLATKPARTARVTHTLSA